ncbi:MAG: hypothetical protein K2Z81_17130 [Cyanobacteria bacterium]|nr:hypothetical protein [Cyanobacteriota bacterium]
MKNKSMKLMPSLHPLSRDHGVVLVCAQYGRKAVCASKADRLKLAEQILAVCQQEISPNLEDEQWILSPIIGDANLRAEFHQRHRDIRELTDQLSRVELSEDPGVGLMSRVANALDDYVRWEENTLYPRISDGIEGYDLQQLSKLTMILESVRNRPTQRLHKSVKLDQPSGLPSSDIESGGACEIG